MTSNEINELKEVKTRISSLKHASYLFSISPAIQEKFMGGMPRAVKKLVHAFMKGVKAEWPEEMVRQPRLAHEAALSLAGVSYVDVLDVDNCYVARIGTDNGEKHYSRVCNSSSLAICSGIAELGVFRLEAKKKLLGAAQEVSEDDFSDDQDS